MKYTEEQKKAQYEVCTRIREEACSLEEYISGAFGDDDGEDTVRELQHLINDLVDLFNQI